jgi:hypothetical protein
MPSTIGSTVKGVVQSKSEIVAFLRQMQQELPTLHDESNDAFHMIVADM